MKKRIVVSIWLIAAVVVFLLSFFLTKLIVAHNDPVEEAEALETFAENEELSYIKWSYNGWQADWVDDSNLTSTGALEQGYAESAFLIGSWEEYQALSSSITQKEQMADDATDGAYSEHEICIHALSEEIDSSFFTEHQLAVIDFCYEGSPGPRSRLHELQITNSIAIVTIQVEYLVASTAEQTGFVYWIPVPRDCTDVVTEFQETKWARP